MTHSTTIPTRLRPTGIHEMVLEVADLEASTRFYEEVIGLQIVQRWGDDRPAVWFDMGDTAALGLWTPKAAIGAIANGRGGAHVHFALRIGHGTIDETQQRLESLGYEVLRIQFDDGNRSLYVDDPDGHCVELMDAVVDWSNRPIKTSGRQAVTV
jgi:catechol 2,3-dioxygenase-like lactoylglutathione lyase family enzyme